MKKYVNAIKQWPRKTKESIDGFLYDKWHFQDKQVDLLWHYLCTYDEDECILF